MQNWLIFLIGFIVLITIIWLAWKSCNDHDGFRGKGKEGRIENQLKIKKHL